MNVCVVVAAEHDLHADAVIDHLNRVDTVIRIDPFNGLPPLRFYSTSDEIEIGEFVFRIGDVSGIFCRVALERVNFDLIVDPVEKFCAREHLDALIGILLTINCNRWINFPWNDSMADGKIFPLRLAASVGIKVPSFVVSSKGFDLIKFEAAEGQSIIKPISDMAIARQSECFVETPFIGNFEAPYTNDFDTSKLPNDGIEDDTPTLVQKKICKLGDVRVVVIDELVFATYLVHNSLTIDSRLTVERSETRFELSHDLRERLLDLIHAKLRLWFAAIDLVHGVDDEFYLVDVNPCGNWLWQETGLGVQISKAISERLSNNSQ